MGRRVDRLHRPPATPAGEAAGAARAAPTTYPAPGQPGTSRPRPVAPGPASLAWPAAFAPAVVTRREIFRLAASSCQVLDMGTGTCASYCVPFKRLCGLGFGGAFAAGLFGLGREGDGPAADRAAAGGQLPGGVDPGVHGGAGYADAVGYLPRGELAVGEQGGGGDVVVVAEVGG